MQQLQHMPSHAGPRVAGIKFSRAISFLAVVVGLVAITAADGGLGSDFGKVKADLAKRAQVKSQQIEVFRSEAVTWPDASLGLATQDEMSAAVLTPGQAVVLQAKGSQYLYTLGPHGFRFGGPMALVGESLLTIRPLENEPNLNGDLVQTSVVGTNPRVLIPRVSGYEVQPDGSLLALRRTSRSGFDLLYLAPNGAPDSVTLIDAAFSYGAIASEEESHLWAAVVRERVGLEYSIAYGDTTQAKGSRKLMTLPEAQSPTRLYWSGKYLYAKTKQGFYVMDSSAQNPTWEKTGAPLVADEGPAALSRSETIDVVAVHRGDKVVTQVVSEWFTGRKSVVVEIPGFEVRSYRLIRASWLVIFGKDSNGETAYLVDPHSKACLRTLSTKRGLIAAYPSAPAFPEALQHFISASK